MNLKDKYHLIKKKKLVKIEIFSLLKNKIICSDAKKFKKLKYKHKNNSSF